MCPTQLCHSWSCCDWGSVQGVMGLQQGESSDKLDVLEALESVLRVAHRISKEEERQAEEGKQVEIRVGDRRLKFGFVAGEKASGENIRRKRSKPKSREKKVEVFGSF